ncbi:MAG TPA: S26 family signal peptidase [Candidatus Saccharibacteria bacterium]|nr:S26 family signal peptidase [Candidatus Saccharibacteria bacterium]
MITITLAENEIFLVGDNRPVSIDSRFNGPVNTTQLIGVAIQ